MDAVIRYLPSPDEKQPVKDKNNKNLIRNPSKSDPLCAYAFKII